jgi:hypothetical protein
MALNSAQQETLDHYKGYGVKVSWFVGEPTQGNPLCPDDTIEVIALGNDFAWSILIYPDGEPHTSEAVLGPFDTGLTI